MEHFSKLHAENTYQNRDDFHNLSQEYHYEASGSTKNLNDLTNNGSILESEDKSSRSSNSFISNNREGVHQQSQNRPILSVNDRLTGKPPLGQRENSATNRGLDGAPRT